MRAQILPIESALGSGPPIQSRKKGLFSTCSRELRLPKRVANITNALRTTLSVGILGFLRLSVIAARALDSPKIFSP
jgi:hypothetical protein